MTEQSQAQQFNCRRPLVRVLADAAFCNYCGAERGEPCRIKRYAELGPISMRVIHPDGTVEDRR